MEIPMHQLSYMRGAAQTAGVDWQRHSSQGVNVYVGGARKLSTLPVVVLRRLPLFFEGIRDCC